MDVKARGGIGKAVLRDLLYRHVPQALVDRPKAGFTVPVGSWLRGPLTEWAESLISPRALERTSVFDTAAVRRLWDQHRSGQRDHATALWAVLMYQAWRG